MSFNNSKRSIQSSSNSDSSPIKKKSKIALKRTLTHSSSSDEIDIPVATTKKPTTTTKKESSPVATRIRIQRSSSSSSSDNDSNGSDEIITKRTRRRPPRKKPTPTNNERSTILNQMKRQTRERKKSGTTLIDKNNNNSRKKSSFEFSDEELELDEKPTTTKDNNESTESYEVDSDDQEKEMKSDNDEESSPTKRQNGRKNIRKIIDDKKLDLQTQHAVQAELERRKRIDEKQKEYNDTLLEQSFDKNQQQTTDSTNRLILELDSNTNEPLIEVSSKLVQHLKPHQCDGIRFLWNNVFESIDAIQNKKQQSNGCILAHCMGLGKTLQVISFLHTIFNYDRITKVKTCLVLCPINTALNWSNEFEHWLNDVDPPIDHYQLTTIKPNLRVTHLNYWYEHGGVMIMGYEMYRRLANGIGLRNKKIKAQALKCLVDPGPDVIIADEGHILKNAQTALAKCLSKIRTSRRIVLTGTPLQNNLIEYYCMVSFIKPNLLGSQQEYINRFVNPIQNGQHRDSNDDDVRLMKRRACVLHELLTGFIDRKDYSLLKEYLPPKFEYIINIRMSDLQTNLYGLFLNKQTATVTTTKQEDLIVNKKDFKSAKLFADYQYLQKIWTHPFLLYPYFIDHWKKSLNKDEDDFLDDEDFDAMFTDEDEEENKNKKKKKTTKTTNDKEKEFSGFLIDNADDGENSKSSNDEQSYKTDSNSSDNDDEQAEVVKNYRTRSRTAATIIENQQQQQKQSNKKSTNSDVYDTENLDVHNIESNDHTNDNDEQQPWSDEMREQYWFPFLDMLPDESEFDINLSGKFILLKSILDKCTDIGDKILLFSRSLYTLNYIERFLYFLHKQNQHEYEQQRKTNPHLPLPYEWIRDQDYFRMDGQTDVSVRKRYAQAFNDPKNLRSRLFLISTLAGGIGINLVGSNRVIVFDASWNPSHDTQAIFRSYRFGQKKPVYIYRFLSYGTMEEKIYQRQVVKQSLSQRVIDDHQLDRHFTENDIKELYKFTREQMPDFKQLSNTNFPYSIPKDHLLLDLLYDHNQWIHSYHSHDSLLENKLDEGLTDDERQRALEEYENLKRLPDQRQMLAAQRLQQQQQQQQQTASNMFQLPNLQKMYYDLFRSMGNDDRQSNEYKKMFQTALELGLGQFLPDSITQPKTTADKNDEIVLLDSDDDD